MKKLLQIFILTTITVLLSGCFKSEELDHAEIYTTIYPIEYLLSELYGYNSEIYSIYPIGIDLNEYELSNKKIKKYSKTDLFVYNGLTDEKKIAASFVNNNSNLKIIDVTEGLAIKYSFEELWLNPSNYLMLAQNTQKGLERYIESTILKEEIENNYNQLKLTISEFETTLKLLSQNGKYNTLVVSKDYFKYLENFGFEIISVEETDDLSNDTINRVKKLIKNKDIINVYVTDTEAKNEKYSETIESLKSEGAEIKVLNTMTILNSEQTESNENYETIMKSNIELLKEEIYK